MKIKSLLFPRNIEILPRIPRNSSPHPPIDTPLLTLPAWCQSLAYLRKSALQQSSENHEKCIEITHMFFLSSQINHKKLNLFQHWINVQIGSAIGICHNNSKNKGLAFFGIHKEHEKIR